MSNTKNLVIYIYYITNIYILLEYSILSFPQKCHETPHHHAKTSCHDNTRLKDTKCTAR